MITLRTQALDCLNNALGALRLSHMYVLVVLFADLSFAQTRSPAPQDDTQVWPEVQITMPLNNRVDLTVNGQLRVGRRVTDLVDERGGMGLAVKVGKYLTLAPSYLHIATQPTPDRKAFENRLNFAATVRLPAFKSFIVTDRNLIERRFRTPTNSTRYRNRLQVERAVKIGGADFRLFVADEVFYDWSVDSWTRNRFAVGMGRSLNKFFSTDVYYM
ncbi:MAG: DUF2490 domain-containing protein, partial [Acidobacteriota bacterium]|nr:DUF2490 domain-containing protein [Acidobacteriota bacterium]